MNIECRPSYALAYVFLEYGESFLCEQGAMAAMSQGVSVAGAMGSANPLRALARRALTDESLFMGRYTAEVHGAWVALAPRFPGDIVEVELEHGDPLIATSGSLLGHASTVEAQLKWSGARSAIMREGLVATRLHGEGVVLLGSYGGIQRFVLGDDEGMVVDTGHLVAWSETVQMSIGLLGGVVASAVSGEGLVAQMTGPGVVYIQTRAEQGIKSWLIEPERDHNKGGKRGR